MTSSVVISDLFRVFKTSVSAVLANCLIKRAIKYNPVNQELKIFDNSYDLKNKNVYLVGMGKAVQNMAREIENILNTKITEGIISIPVGSLTHTSDNQNILYCEGAKNNLPDINAEATAKKVKSLVKKLKNDDFLLVLLSGGGSALLPLPKEPMKLEEKTTLIKKLANSGADITELNTVRKQLSDLKGGRLAIQAQPARVVSLILSDIVEDPLDLIASGPTTANKDSILDVNKILQKYELQNDLPSSVKQVLNEAEQIEPFPEENVKNYIIGSNRLSIAAAMEEARNLNYFSVGLSSTVNGNVKNVAKEYAFFTETLCNFLSSKIDEGGLKSMISTLPSLRIDTGALNDLVNFHIEENRDLCLIFGGETTVNVTGNGIGGRNQQLALEYSTCLHEIKDSLHNFNVNFLSAGTDGIDGPTDAAGAIGYLNLVAESKLENLEVYNYLNENDSYNFYKQFKNGKLHIVTGHTNTNVMDIHIIIIKRKL